MTFVIFAVALDFCHASHLRDPLSVAFDWKNRIILREMQVLLPECVC